jgi:uncharacterized protein YhjY with autotransporter beta-barrel domain
LAFLSTFLMPMSAHADLNTLTANNPAFDDLERAAAAANHSAIDALNPLCVTGPGATCNVAQFGVFESTRELVHTANDLEAAGDATRFSLRLDQRGLGDALRWTAAEEVTAQGTIAKKFANGQLANVNNRMTALRFGATGFSITGLGGMPASHIAGLSDGDELGTAGSSEKLSKWGGFGNGTFGFGDHDPTTFEDAFDFDNTEVTLGFDYRFSERWVAGFVAGYTENEIDFNAARSIVDGGIVSDGYSLGVFGLYSRDALYISGSATYQTLDFQIDRFIKYPSFNPDVASTDTRTLGKTDSDSYTATLNLGYMFRLGPGASKRYVLEPYFRAEFIDVSISSFQEVENDGDGVQEYFNLNVRSQSIKSVELSFGARASFAISTKWGVLFPYARGEWHVQLEDANTATTSTYDVGLSGLTPFLLANEDVDTNYGTAVFGVQTILKGGRQRELGGVIGDRLSLFVEYRTVFSLDNISNDLISGGLRYTF